MFIWINRALALAIHDRQLAEHGGGSGVRDDALLDSALARPQQLFSHGDPPPDLAHLAASLAFGLARNHPFIDGNERTAQVCYRVFLALNDVDLQAKDDEKYIAMLSLADGSLSEAEFAHWIGLHIKSTTPGKVHESIPVYANTAE
jgi:death-on-curing protein